MKVRRKNVWNDSLTKLGKAKKDVYKPLKVQFVGEPPVDQDGSSREYCSEKVGVTFQFYRHKIILFSLAKKKILCGWPTYCT